MMFLHTTLSVGLLLPAGFLLTPDLQATEPQDESVSFGRSTIVMDDTSGDAIPEIVTTAERCRQDDLTGCILVLSGKSGQVLRTSFGGRKGYYYAVDLARTEDFDGDGKSDIACAARPQERQRLPYVTIVSGSSLVQIRVHEGYSVFAGELDDVDGDGLTDYLLDGKDGAHVFSRSDGSPIQSPMNGRHGRTKSGTWVALKGIPDVTGDGVPEFLLVDGGYLDPPRARIISGKDTKVLASIDLPEGHMAGLDPVVVAGAATTNKGGLIAVGFPAADADEDAERGFLSFYSLPDGVLRSQIKHGGTQRVEEDEWFGFSIDSIGDLDGDGESDWLIGAPGDAFRPYVMAYSEAEGRVLWTARSRGEAFTNLGTVVRSTPDLDEDGIPECLASGADCGQGWKRPSYWLTADAVREVWCGDLGGAGARFVRQGKTPRARPQRQSLAREGV